MGRAQFLKSDGQMNRWIKFTGTLLFSGVTVVGLAAFGVLRGWHVPKVLPEQLAAQLQSGFRIIKPEGDGPFPTVLGFHGCGGVSSHGWQEFLAERGYAMVLVDSYASRPQLDTQEVCNGLKFWGSERAGDVWASLQVTQELSFVDRKRLFLMGWSHGGWAIADLLALASSNRLPTNLTHKPGVNVNEIAGVVLMYPYCGFPSVARSKGWSSQVPALMLLAGQDTVADPADCLAIADRVNLRSGNNPFAGTAIAHLYEDAQHVFDLDWDVTGNYDPLVTADARERVLNFLHAQSKIESAESGQ